jgi:hypothetical protein
MFGLRSDCGPRMLNVQCNMGKGFVQNYKVVQLLYSDVNCLLDKCSTVHLNSVLPKVNQDRCTTFYIARVILNML